MHFFPKPDPIIPMEMLLSFQSEPVMKREDGYITGADCYSLHRSLGELNEPILYLSLSLAVLTHESSPRAPFLHLLEFNLAVNSFHEELGKKVQSCCHAAV